KLPWTLLPRLPTKAASGPSKRAKPGTSPLEIEPETLRWRSSCPRTSAVTPRIELCQQPAHRLIVRAQRMGPLQRLPRGRVLAQLVQYCSIDGQRLEEIGTLPERGLQKLAGFRIPLLLKVSETEVVVDLGRFGIKGQSFVKGLKRVIVRVELTEQHADRHQFVDVVGLEDRSASSPGTVRATCSKLASAGPEFLLPFEVVPVEPFRFFEFALGVLRLSDLQIGAPEEIVGSKIPRVEVDLPLEHGNGPPRLAPLHQRRAEIIQLVFERLGPFQRFEPADSRVQVTTCQVQSTQVVNHPIFLITGRQQPFELLPRLGILTLVEAGNRQVITCFGETGIGFEGQLEFLGGFRISFELK